VVGSFCNTLEPSQPTPLSGVHGFLRTRDGFSIIDVPGALGTVASGINARGDVVGYYFGGNQLHGFLWNGTNFAFFDVPGASNTVPFGINARGEISGTYFGPAGHEQGFVRNGDQFATVNLPASFNAMGTIVYGINERGDVVGFYFRGNDQYGFMRVDGEFTSIQVPLPGSTLATGINARGDVVGYFSGVPKTSGWLLANQR